MFVLGISSRVADSVGVVIPILASDVGRLGRLLDLIRVGVRMPDQVVVVISGLICLKNSEAYEECLRGLRNIDWFEIKFVEVDAVLFPGNARNLGVSKVSTGFVAFLDVNTLPNQDWLIDCLSFAKKFWVCGYDCVVVGSCRFEAISPAAILLRDTIFGRSPWVTLPGSLIARETWEALGGFEEGVRSGEDTAMLRKIDKLGLRKVVGSVLLYDGMARITYLEILRKWLRNYTNVVVDPPRAWFLAAGLALFGSSIFAGVFFSAWLLAGLAALFICSYVMLRGIVMPLFKGVTPNILSTLWLRRASLAVALDVIKCLGIGISVLRYCVLTQK